MDIQVSIFVAIYLIAIVVLGNSISWLIRMTIGYHLEKKHRKELLEAREAHSKEIERIAEKVYSDYMEKHSHEMTEEDMEAVEEFMAGFTTKKGGGTSL